MSKTAARRTGIVTGKEFLSPHLIRVRLQVDHIEEFAETTVGDNNKILIPPTGADSIYFPERNPEGQSSSNIPKSQTPVRRTYTHGGLDIARSELFIDFVYHGDHGVASAWAGNCKVGDLLGIMMRTVPKQLFPQVKKYLLVGDATALPAIRAILRQLPEEAEATCILEVYGKEDEIELPSKAKTQIHWLHNPQPIQGSSISEKVKQLSLPEESRFAFIAAEFRTVKELRGYFRKEKEWKVDEISAYSYWRAGLAEDQSEKQRREEKSTAY